MLFRIARALRHLPSQPLAAAGVLLVLWWVCSFMGHFAHLGRLSLVAAGGLLTAAVLVWWTRWLAPVTSTGHWVGRRDETTQHAGGVATWMDIGENAGVWAMRERAKQLRPSLGGMSRLGRWALPVTAYAVLLVRTGWFPIGGQVWSACEETTIRFGGPRSGKSGSLACHALDAPGALLVTTTRTDLLDDTAEHRARRGQVWVFNPTGLGDLKSTVRWSAVVGCDDYATAVRRAGDLIPPGASAEGERWDEQARGFLAVLMHAAALENRRLVDVLDWISPADEVTLHQIIRALQDSPRADALIADVRSVFTTNDRTRTSITATMLPALRWLNDATAAEVGDAHHDDPDLLDVAAFVASSRDSLYLIGREGGSRPLLGALTAEVAHQVRMHAAASLRGRLDPPMTLLLDEAPLTCGPIPLQDWTSDMGGRGCTLHIAAQSPAQLRDVWGHERAEAILGNAATVMVFGGLKTARSLDDLSTLCGTRMMALDPDDVRPQPVMTAQQISALPTGTALVLRNSLPPVIGRAPMIWDRRTPRWRWRAQDTLTDWTARARTELTQRTATWRRPTLPDPFEAAELGEDQDHEDDDQPADEPGTPASAGSSGGTGTDRAAGA